MQILDCYLLERFLPDHALKLLACRLEVVPSPVEGLDALVVREVDIDEQFLEVGVLQAVLNSIALLRIEHQHLLQQAVSVGVGLGENLFHTLLVALGELADVLARQVVADKAHVVARRCAQHRDRALDLVQVVVTWEEGSTPKQLGEDAAQGPDVERVGVMASVEDDLRCTVPARDDVLSERRGGFFVTARQTEIANLQRAVFVKQQVARLQVAMDDVRRVHVVAACQHLKHEVLQMVVGEVLA